MKESHVNKNFRNTIFSILLISFFSYAPSLSSTANLDGYFYQIETKSRTRIPDTIKKSVIAFYKERRLDPYKVLSKIALKQSHDNFNSNRWWLIEEWKFTLKLEWLVYGDKTLCIRNGKCAWKKPGGDYDAHHIIPQSHGGPNLWWNLWPLTTTTHNELHKAGACCALFPKSCGDRGCELKVNSGWSKTGKCSYVREVNKKRIMITRIMVGKSYRYRLSIDGKSHGTTFELLKDAKEKAVSEVFL